MYDFLRIVRLAALLLAAGPLCAQITEWPTTVARGSFLLEMDALSLTRDTGPDYKYTAISAASTFLSTGLAPNWDIQVGAELFICQKLESGGFTERNHGIGDIYVRTKWRFYENAATGTSMAILPYVKFPTNSGGVGNKNVEGGIIVPWTTKLVRGCEFAAMAELDFLRNDAGDGFDTYWFVSAALSRSLTKVVGLYGEVALGKLSGVSATDGMLGGGVTLAASENSWWDCAVYKGVSGGAVDWNYVVRFNLGF